MTEESADTQRKLQIIANINTFKRWLTCPVLGFGVVEPTANCSYCIVIILQSGFKVLFSVPRRSMQRNFRVIFPKRKLLGVMMVA